VDAGEQSGTLERTLHELSRYYEFQQRIWRHFLGQIFLPVMQYVAAVAVVALTMYILGFVAGEPPWSPGTVLLVGYGAPVGLVALYEVLVHGFGATRLCHEAILRIPVVGKVMEALALSRFSLVLYLMYEAGAPIMEGLRRAFEGTGNGAFAARAPKAVRTVQQAGSLTEAISSTGLFPQQYTDIMAVAEQSGKVSERLDWMARHYGERAEASMAALAAVIARLVWVVVAVVIISFIFKMFMRYVGAIEHAMPR